MKKLGVLWCAMFVPLLTANKCDDGNSVDADSPSSICDHVMDLCGNDFFDGDKDACVKAVSPLEKCRKECAADQKTCDTVDQCLLWNLGYGGVVDEYCLGDGDGDYNTLEECAIGECPSEQSSCNNNSSCTGIFDDCLSGCADWDCVDLCASTGYSGGIDDFTALWNCLGNSCSEFK